METNKPQDSATVVHTKRKVSLLEDGHSKQLFVLCNLKHEINWPKLYEFLISTKLKGETALDTKNLYNHIKMCLNVATIRRQNIIHEYQKIKSNFGFDEHFYQTILTLPTLVMSRNTRPLVTNFYWILLMTTVSNIPCHLKPTRLSPPTPKKYWDGLSYPYFYMLDILI